MPEGRVRVFFTENDTAVEIRPTNLRHARETRYLEKHQGLWRVVVADQRSKRDGRVIETVGHYNAQTNPSTIVLDEERIQSWLARGAQPSETVRKLLRTQGISPPGSA